MQLFNELKRRNVIRVAIAYVAISWVILQAVDVILNNIEGPVWIFQLLLLVLAVGLIPTVMFSWAFELTPEGFKRDEEVSPGQPTAGRGGRKLTLVITTFISIGVAYFLYDKLISDSMEPADTVASSESADTSPVGDVPGIPPIDDKSIAVLPFTNMSGDEGTEPFALGIHDDLLTHLSRIKALKTTSRTSVLQYKDTNKTIPRIAAELGVINILEGSIQRSGDRVRINMQLIDARTDEHLWAEIYDRDLTAENLFAVQGEIATAVTKAMSAALLPEEQEALAETPTQSLEAYDLYLAGRYHWHQQTAESTELALGYFEQAIEVDPYYVPALAGLADTYVALIRYGNLEGREGMPAAEQTLERAMGLDSENAEVWTSLGQLQALKLDQAGSLASLERAIELDPQNYWAWYWYWFVLDDLRRFEDALAALETAYALEPMSRPVNETLGYTYRRRGSFVLARQHFERVDQLVEGDITQWKEAIAWVYLDAGELARAVAQARRVLALDPVNIDAMSVLVRAYIRLGDIDQAEMWAQAAQEVDAFSVLMLEVYRAREEFQAAVQFLNDWDMRMGGTAAQVTNYYRMMYAYWGGMEESALHFLNELLKIVGPEGGPVNPFVINQRDYLVAIEFTLALSAGRANLEIPGDVPDRSGMALRNLDKINRALQAMHNQDYDHPKTHYSIAMANMLSGDPEGALLALGEAVDRGLSEPQQLAWEFTFRPIRDDPRFQMILDQVNARVGQQLEQLEDMQLAKFTPQGQRPVVILPRAQLEQYTGWFTNGNIHSRFYLDERGRFTVKLFQIIAPKTLVASEDGVFFDPATPAETFRFSKDNDNNVTHILWEEGGRSKRLKLTEPPPPEIEVDREVLERYVGTYAGEFIKGAEGGTSDVDVWVIRIFIDEEGTVWADYDNQPDLVIKPFAENKFFTPGYMAWRTFEIDPETGNASRFIWHMNMRDLPFERIEQE